MSTPQYQVVTSKRNTIILKNFITLQVYLQDITGNPLAGYEYLEEYSGSPGRSKKTTSSQGLAAITIPKTVTNLTLVSTKEDENDRKTWKIKVEPLQPPSELKGMQQRLQNLGIYGGDISGNDDKSTKDAIKIFQKMHGLEMNGEPGKDMEDSLLNPRVDRASWTWNWVWQGWDSSIKLFPKADEYEYTVPPLIELADNEKIVLRQKEEYLEEVIYRFWQDLYAKAEDEETFHAAARRIFNCFDDEEDVDDDDESAPGSTSENDNKEEFLFYEDFETLRSHILEKPYFSFLPHTIKFTDELDEHNANGAYTINDGGIIYIDNSIRDDKEKLQDVFYEEAAHHIDAIVKSSETDALSRGLAGNKVSIDEEEVKLFDANKDEGEKFAHYLLNGLEVTERDEKGDVLTYNVDAVGNDCDSQEIVLDGKKCVVEFQKNILYFFFFVYPNEKIRNYKLKLVNENNIIEKIDIYANELNKIIYKNKIDSACFDNTNIFPLNNESNIENIHSYGFKIDSQIKESRGWKQFKATKFSGKVLNAFKKKRFNLKLTVDNTLDIDCKIYFLIRNPYLARGYYFRIWALFNFKKISTQDEFTLKIAHELDHAMKLLSQAEKILKRILEDGDVNIERSWGKFGISKFTFDELFEFESSAFERQFLIAQELCDVKNRDSRIRWAVALRKSLTEGLGSCVVFFDFAADWENQSKTFKLKFKEAVEEYCILRTTKKK